ncbi:hypothetical protein [Bacillus safensis]|uniref:Uncharacterized protein n=1 Tax=Bacillus safensis TaxID=561879 RepID=A0AC61YQP6_BACIA|nr:hypothetical protein [Bacillus safensis]QRF33911.1 hypothetical protein JNE45_08605 [Bacillus safensis]WGD97073.1 hypothetical protein P5627_14625 [Bacillus safensis]
MDNQLLLQGKILGQIYRIQNRQGYCPVTEATIYGLLNGIESVVKDELEELNFIPDDNLTKLSKILSVYYNDKEKLSEVSGYYDLELDIENAGITREEARQILIYFYARGQFVELINKFNSSNSPVECKTFKIPDWDK